MSNTIEQLNIQIDTYPITTAETDPPAEKTITLPVGGNRPNIVIEFPGEFDGDMSNGLDVQVSASGFTLEYLAHMLHELAHAAQEAAQNPEGMENPNE